MQFDFNEQETDYLYRVLVARPMAEVESLVGKIRAGVQWHQGQQARKLAAQEAQLDQQAALGRPNGAAPWEGMDAGSEAP